VENYHTTTTAFTIGCDGVTTPCTPPSNNQMGISFRLSGENICGQLLQNIGVEPSLVTYSDSDYTLESNNFLIESGSNSHVAYFQASATSNQVSITSVEVIQASITSSVSLGGTRVLWNGGANEPETSHFSFAISPSDSSKFSIAINSQFLVPTDSSDSIDVEVNLAITYTNGQKKRAILSTGTTSSITSTNIKLQTSNSSMIALSWSLIMALGVLYSFFV